MNTGTKCRLKSTFFLLLIPACSFYTEKNPGDPATIVPGTINWQQVSTQVFQPRCAICHSQGGAGFNSSTYQSVVDQINTVQNRVFERKNMPPDSPLTDYESTLLQDWINEGTPENIP